MKVDNSEYDDKRALAALTLAAKELTNKVLALEHSTALEITARERGVDYRQSRESLIPDALRLAQISDARLNLIRFMTEKPKHQPE